MTATLHPLEPLTIKEVQTAVTLVRQQKGGGGGWRFPVVTLKEPHKDSVLAYQPGEGCDRPAFLVLLDHHTGHTYEAVVSLTQQQVIAWTHLPDIQPNIMADELEDCEAAVRAHPRVTFVGRTLFDPRYDIPDYGQDPFLIGL